MEHLPNFAARYHTGDEVVIRGVEYDVVKNQTTFDKQETILIVQHEFDEPRTFLFPPRHILQGTVY